MLSHVLSCSIANTTSRFSHSQRAFVIHKLQNKRHRWRNIHCRYIPLSNKDKRLYNGTTTGCCMMHITTHLGWCDRDEIWCGLCYHDAYVRTLVMHYQIKHLNDQRCYAACVKLENTLIHYNVIVIYIVDKANDRVKRWKKESIVVDDTSRTRASSLCSQLGIAIAAECPPKAS